MMPTRRRQWLASTAAWMLCHPITSWAGENSPAGVLKPRELRFPRDHGTHNEARTEWWYLTGHGEDIDGQPWGFQVTFFRSRVDPASSLSSRLAARHLLFAHAAITDVRSARLHHDQRMHRWNGAPPGSPLAQQHAYASESDTAVRLNDWHLQRDASGHYQTRISGNALGIELTAQPSQPLLLQGDQGFSRKGPDPSQSSFYITHPQLAVQGQLRIDGRMVQITGRAWLDHEWSEALMHPDAVGWDWIGMNLHDGSCLTAFRLRRRDGSAVWAGGSWRGPVSGATGVAPARPFGPDEVQWLPGRRWTSPRTGASYPVEWQVLTPVGRFTVNALMDAQELDSRASTGTVYWEGVSDLLDQHGRAVGRGYLEMTGYASRLVL
ncbi:MAG: hypothetical protein PWQ61_2135 [Betaproteobacteria bacterium]|nr:hypothetical protein [Betaproteobacteria bacterium]